MSKFWVIDEDRFYLFELEVAESRVSSFKERVNANGDKERGASNGVPLDQ